MASRRAPVSSHRAASAVLLLPLLLGLLVVPPSHSQSDECQVVDSARVPEVAARDGTPLVVAVELSPCALARHHEVRAWLGNATHQASRVYDGQEWSTSQHYTQLEPLAHKDGVHHLPLQANPDATHANALIGQPSSTQAWLRLRGTNATTTSVPLGTIEWVDEDQVVPYWANPDAATFVETNGDLLGSTLQNVDKKGHSLPQGFSWLALPKDAPPSPAPPVLPGDLLIARMVPSLHEGGSLIEILVKEGIEDLQGLRLVSRGGTIVLPKLPVGPGSLVHVSDSPQALIAPLQEQLPGTDFPDPVRVAWGDPEEGEDATVAVAETVSGRFQMARSGGSLQLEYGDLVLDAFAYGDSEAPDGWEGESMEATRIEHRVYLRSHDEGSFFDTDSVQDWQRPRIHRQHQSDLDTRWFTVQGPVRAFVCPDRCHEEIVLRIDNAQATIDVNLYEITLPSIVQALAEAQARGVEVRVLIHDRPVGASTFRMDRVAWAVDLMLESGAEVRTLEGTRYDVNHAKYLVVDEAWTVVTTENAVSSGWPPDGTRGNRGHGVAVQDAGLATWTTKMFETDYLHPVDATVVTGTDLHKDRQNYDPPAISLLPPTPGEDDRIPTLVVEGPFPVAPILAPDHLGDPKRNPIVETLHQAQEEIGLAQMNLPLHWSRAGHTQDSPFAEALVGAAERGVRVTGTLADAFIDDPERDGNHRTAAALHLAADPIDLRLAGGPNGDGVVHAKTWWTDPGSPNGVAITGSANGNLASQALNREFALILAQGEIASFWAAVGADDHAKGTHFSAYAPERQQEADDESAQAPLAPPVLLVVLVTAAASRVAGARNRPRRTAYKPADA